jgi:hypothetical protein
VAAADFCSVELADHLSSHQSAEDSEQREKKRTLEQKVPATRRIAHLLS